MEEPLKVVKHKASIMVTMVIQLIILFPSVRTNQELQLIMVIILNR